MRTFLKSHLNITFADNELVEDEEGEDDSHREGEEAKLVRVDLCLFGAENIGINRYLLTALAFVSRFVLTDPSTLCCLNC